MADNTKTVGQSLARISSSRFGFMFDLVLALRSHGVPLDALKLNFFTAREQAEIRAGYYAPLADLLEFNPTHIGFTECSDCGGSGVALNAIGEPDTCKACRGNTVVAAAKAEPANV